MNIRKDQIIWLIFVILLLVSFQGSTFAADENKERNIWDAVKNDHQQFYSCDRLIRMGIVFGGGGVLANTFIDEHIQDWYQNHVRNSGTDEFAEAVKIFGEGKYLIPLSVVLATIDYYFNLGEKASVFGNWGERVARAYLVGAPATLLMQRVTGASRPGEIEEGSNWNPFNDENGVSGHAFIGSVPFLTIARMNEENRAIKYLFYTLSIVISLMRMNDDDHFTSQALLGWYMAWEATDSIWMGYKEKSKITIRPLLSHDSYGAYVSLKW